MRNYLESVASVFALVLLPLAPAHAEEPASKRTAEPMPLSELRLLVDVLDVIEREYITERSRINLMKACLKGMGAEAPRQQELLDYYRAFKPGYESWGANTPNDITPTEACMDGIIAALDRNSAFFGGASYRSMIGLNRKNVAGIGLELERSDLGPTVISTHKNGPANQAGIKTGDVILQIDGRDASRMPLETVVHLLRGNPGTHVNLVIRSAAKSAPASLEVERRLVQRMPATVNLIDHGIALVNVDEFSSDSLQEVVLGIYKAHQQSETGLQGILLDLRENTGGVLNVIVAFAAMFLDEGALVLETKGRHKDANLRLLADRQHYQRAGQKNPLSGLPIETRTVPLVVLISPKTSSGAEAVAASLQDHRRATIVGEKSNGRAFVATILPLSGDAAIKLTTASMWRPNGSPLDGFGVVPDVKVNRGTPGMPDMVLKKGIEILRQMDK